MDIVDTLTARLGAGSREARDEARRQAKQLRGRIAGRPNPLRSLVLLVGGALAGAAATFFFDPARGRGRRARYADQLAATVRRGSRAAERALRVIGSDAGGRINALRHGGEEARVLNDAELAHAVETELFRDPSVPKGRLNINVERGIVVLRGEVASDAQRDRIAKRAARISGVWSVRNLMHLPGEPAPETELVRG